jgi:TolB-like protein
MIGKTISHYEILEKLGEGGMGVVYKAQDLELDRIVALKFLSPLLTADEAERKRFEHEAKAVSALDHPNICTFYELGKTDNGQLFLAMAYYEGQTVREKIKEKPLPLSEALDIALGMAQGLSKAHEKGVTHRDIKSENIIITTDGGVKIMDFGLAKIAGASTLTKTGATLGTVPYMSPEQARGDKLDHRTDIWSFGMVLYEMITGRLPFKSDYNDAVIYSILNQDPEPVTALRTGVPMELERIISKCLEKNASDRYQHMDDIIVDLQKVRRVSGEAEQKPPRRTRINIKWNKWLRIGVSVAIVALLLIFFFPFSKSPDLTIRSIAVLPLDNLSRDPEQEYFADGMTEALITDLAKISALRVISRTSVMLYKTRKKTIPEIAKELNVDAVVEGSVQRSGDRVRITAQLLHAPTDRHLWAESYERNLTDILALQSEVASAIVKEIRAKVTPEEEARLTSTRPVDKDAHDLYLRGNFFLHKSDEESMNRALDYFQKSIEKDRSYAPPYAGVAYAYATLADAYLPPKDAYPKAKSAAVKALELDSTIAEARAALAFILGAYERDQLSSQREFRRAMEFNPNSVDVLWLSALYLGFRTGSAEAIAQADRAIALDPLNPFASWTKENVLLQARQYDEVIEQHKRTVELDPNFFYADSPVSRAYQEKGMLKEALDEYMKVQKLMPEQPLYGLAVLYAHMGRQQEAKNILSDLMNESTKRYIAPTGPALVYIALGEKDLAFDWLDRAYEAHDTFLNGLKTDGRYDPIRSDPRYAVLVKKMGLEK